MVGSLRGIVPFKNANAVLDSCKKDVACYVRFLDTPVPTTPPAARMGHVKAAWMAAIYGDAATKASLVSMVERVKDGSVRLALVEAIGHLSPNGDAAAAAKLEAVVEQDRSNGTLSGSDEVFKLALKLRSRLP